MLKPLSIVIDGNRLISGVSTLISSMLKQVLNEHEIPIKSYYCWKGFYIDGYTYVMNPLSKDIGPVEKLPSTLDREMFNIHKHYKKVRELVSPITTCMYLSKSVFITANFIPKLILENYTALPTYIPPLPTDHNLAKFILNMALINPKLNWLHENNILMQTL